MSSPPRVPFFCNQKSSQAHPGSLFKPQTNASITPLTHTDGEVVEMCAKHTPFYPAGAYENPKTKLIIGDAKAGLEACDDASIDVIICDLSDRSTAARATSCTPPPSTTCASPSSRPEGSL